MVTLLEIFAVVLRAAGFAVLAVLVELVTSADPTLVEAADEVVLIVVSESGAFEAGAEVFVVVEAADAVVFAVVCSGDRVVRAEDKAALRSMALLAAEKAGLAIPSAVDGHPRQIRFAGPPGTFRPRSIYEIFAPRFCCKDSGCLKHNRWRGRSAVHFALCIFHCSFCIPQRAAGTECKMRSAK